METLTIALDLPRDLLGALDVPPSELGSRVTQVSLRCTMVRLEEGREWITTRLHAGWPS